MGEFCFENSWNILNGDVYCRQNGYDRAREGSYPSGTDLELEVAVQESESCRVCGTESKLTVL